MPISAISPTTPNTQAAQNMSRPGATEDGGLDRDTFLKIMVAQLRMQDPMDPVDSDQMLTQTTQLLQAERIMEIAELTREATGIARLQAAGNLVGKTVTFDLGAGLESGFVSAAAVDGGDLMLTIGDKQVPASAISGIKVPDETAD